MRANAGPRLRAAIDRDELELCYVPILSVATGELAAVRAELRWDGTDRSPISGRELTDALDDTGLIVVARNRALRDGCAQLERWRKARHGAVAPQLAIAVSPRQLAQASFRDHVARAVSDLGIAPGQLCVVVGDRALAHEITDAWTMLRHLRALGVQVAIEGFGSGTSSLADIREARVDQIWLHPQARRWRLLPGSEDEAIVEHVIGLGHKLGIIVVADQVETATQAAILRRLGCDRVTGPLIGADLNPAEVAKLMVPAAPPPTRPLRTSRSSTTSRRPPAPRSCGRSSRPGPALAVEAGAEAGRPPTLQDAGGRREQAVDRLAAHRPVVPLGPAERDRRGEDLIVGDVEQGAQLRLDGICRRIRAAEAEGHAASSRFWRAGYALAPMLGSGSR